MGKITRDQHHRFVALGIFSRTRRRQPLKIGDHVMIKEDNIIHELYAIKKRKAIVGYDIPSGGKIRKTFSLKDIRLAQDYVDRIGYYKRSWSATYYPTLPEAKKIFGKDLIGPGAAFKTFGIRLTKKELAMAQKIPFSVAELQNAKKSGMISCFASRTTKKASRLPFCGCLKCGAIKKR
jgi:hypothetical protein